MPAKRVNISFTSLYERRVLDWLVRRLPASVSPDMLTMVGMLGAVITLVAYALTLISPHFLWLASFGLIVHWFGDSLDGSLARFRSIERPRYGYFIDQTVDVAGNLLIGLGIALSPFVRPEVALFTMTGYHMLSIYVFVRAYVSREFHVSVLHSGPTEIRILIITMNLLISAFGAPVFELYGYEVTWCDIAMSALSVGFIGAFGYLVIDYAAVLRRADDEASELRKLNPGS